MDTLKWILLLMISYSLATYIGIPILCNWDAVASPWYMDITIKALATAFIIGGSAYAAYKI